jgi:hypothetical protein
MVKKQYVIDKKKKNLFIGFTLQHSFLALTTTPIE